MIKKCMNTGLMYLCKTSSDLKSPYLYLGSGKTWLSHLSANNSYVLTCIIGEYETKQELSQAGIYYSKLFDVVNSPHWANLTEERGNGGLIGTGQLGRHWKVRDTTKMRNKKTQTPLRKEAYKRIQGKDNYQFRGYIKTPWGIFESVEDATKNAKLLRQAGNNLVISDSGTLRKYINNPEISLNIEGRRTPKIWRGKTPRELGFDITKDK